MAGGEVTTPGVNADSAVAAASADLPEGGRHDLRHGLSPDAPETASYSDREGAFGYVHSYETGSRLDGPGVRVTLFVSGCPLR
jgi:pyruvate formate lyase activating enzyme